MDPNQNPNQPNIPPHEAAMYYYNMYGHYPPPPPLQHPHQYSQSQHTNFGGFAQYSQPQQPPTQPQPPPTPAVDLGDDDVVEETQPPAKKIPRRKSHAKKAPGETHAARQIKKWPVNEEIFLAKAWIDTSENPIIGNNQRNPIFWQRVCELYISQMGCAPDYRTADQLSSKWGHMNKIVKKFAAIYDECKRTYGSGNNDKDVMAKEPARFQDDGHGKVPLEVWKLCSASPKWQELYMSAPGQSSRKRPSESEDVEPSPGESDGRSRAPLDVDDEDETDPIPRPIGRKKAKSIASGSASGSVNSQDDIGKEIVEQLRVFNLRGEEKAARKGEKEARRLEKERLMEEKEEMEIMDIDLDTLTGFKRRFYEKRQAEIRKKYGLE